MHHCGRFVRAPLTRRQMLSRCANGFGAVALMALRSHVLASFRVADYATGETTLARGVWAEIPEDSLTIVDRNFLVKKDLIRLETDGNRHCGAGGEAMRLAQVELGY